MKDIVEEIGRARRQVSVEGESATLLVRRRYDAEVEEVWDACTDAGRLARWLAPVSGDLRLGGRYQLEGNAGGEILACEPPSLLKVTWVYGGEGSSEVEVRLAEADGGTLFELRHAAVVPPGMWDRYGPGAVGVGWDLSLLGLAMHLAGEPQPDPESFGRSADGARFIAASGQAWGEAHRSSGADEEQAASAAKNTIAFYTP
ncbi:SRPBCC family protein [Nonomuraea roseola]|uniref:SRPBCC family protein n=1 Tax=Nonomuraea roseola TaxID=46179 RepID=A0ABV5PQL9_9ACTN